MSLITQFCSQWRKPTALTCRTFLALKDTIQTTNVLANCSIQISKKCHTKSYIQGQSPEPRIREYFYYINDHGMLFLDDAKMKNFTSAYKDKQFIKFFVSRIKMNSTGTCLQLYMCLKNRLFQYPVFRYLS